MENRRHGLLPAEEGEEKTATGDRRHGPWSSVQFTGVGFGGHAACMGSAKKPKDPPPPPPPVSTTGADVAQETAAAKKREQKRYDFSKTILRPGGLGATMGEGTRNTLG